MANNAIGNESHPYRYIPTFTDLGNCGGSECTGNAVINPALIAALEHACGVPAAIRNKYHTSPDFCQWYAGCYYCWINHTNGYHWHKIHCDK